MDIFGYYIPIELLFILCVVFGVLIICSSIFGIISLKNKSDSISELVVRTNSWWKMAIGITVVATAPAIIGTIVLAYVVFVALREMLSIIPLRTADRTVLVASYIAIPIQFYLAYKNYYYLFQIFIPLVMFISVSVILVLTGETNRIGRSMAIIPTTLMLTVYMPSHMVLLYHVSVPGFTVGAGGLIIFLIMINGCVGTSSQGLFGTGVSIAIDPRSLGTQIDDNIMQKNLTARLLLVDKKYLLSVNTKVLDGRIFLTGKVDDPEEKLKITKMAWETKGVRSVKNAITIKGQSNFKSTAKDILITSQLRSALIFNKKTKARNYTLETINKNIYIFGIAMDIEEKQEVVNEANKIYDVKEVFPSIYLASELSRNKI